MLALARRAQSGVPPPVDVVLAAVMDEEHRHRGVLHVLGSGRSFAGAVVGEPTELRMVIGHKGCVRFAVRTLGRGAHSSQPGDGDNAIRRMADVIRFVEDDMTADLARISDPLVGSPTICSTIVRGGAGINIVPPECTLFIDRRIIPGEDPGEVFSQCKTAIEALAPGSIEVLEPMVTAPALAPPGDGAAVVTAMAASLGRHELDPEPCGVNYGSDASKIRAAGVPSIVFGPGTIADAHQPDESVRLADVEAAASVVMELIDRFRP
jgi:acetylornithine deacetylase